MKWFLQRMKEPSTWLGLAMLAPQVIVIAQAGNLTAQGVAAIAGGIAGVLIKEKGPEDGSKVAG